MTLSARLQEIADALPLEPGMRVVEIGCGPGALARELGRRVDPGFVLAVDRSTVAVSQAEASCAVEIRAGRMAVRCCAAEDLVLEPGEAPFDLAVAVRVGALDGRHPEREELARSRIAAVLRPGGVLFLDGGDPLRRVPLS